MISFLVSIRGWGEETSTVLLNIEKIATEINMDPDLLVTGIAKKLRVPVIGKYELAGMHHSPALVRASHVYMTRIKT